MKAAGSPGALGAARPSARSFRHPLLHAPNTLHQVIGRGPEHRILFTDGTDRLRDGAPVRITEGVDGQKVTPAEAPAGTEQKRGRRRQQP